MNNSQRARGNISQGQFRRAPGGLVLPAAVAAAMQAQGVGQPVPPLNDRAFDLMITMVSRLGTTIDALNIQGFLERLQKLEVQGAVMNDPKYKRADAKIRMLKALAQSLLNVQAAIRDQRNQLAALSGYADLQAGAPTAPPPPSPPLEQPHAATDPAR
jgi:hypothetical protein